MKTTVFEYKLEYMAKLFKAIKNKKYESYVIQRIWHLLNDDTIQFSAQQYIKRNEEQYALADLYLPQLRMVIEVDEAQHNIESNIELDKQRTDDIKNTLGDIVVERVRIYKDEKTPCSMQEIHKRVDEVVNTIKERKKKLEESNNFTPWNGNFLSVGFHQERGYFSTKENHYIRTIDDAAEIFKTKAKHKGFLRAGGFDVPNTENTIVWLPNVNNKDWANKLSADGEIIEEYNNDENKRKKHIKEQIEKNETRITFFREKDELGFNFYKFIGVFELNQEETLKENKCIWKKIADEYDFSHRERRTAR